MKKPLTWIGVVIAVGGLYILYQGLIARAHVRFLGIPTIRTSGQPNAVEVIVGLVVAAAGAYLALRSLKKTA